MDTMDKGLKQTLASLKKFRDERNWKQFHNSKDLALALSIECAELNELFLWKKPEDVDPTKLKAELADVFIYGLLLADKHNLDMVDIVNNKIRENAKKYPVELSKGNARKDSEH